MSANGQFKRLLVTSASGNDNPFDHFISQDPQGIMRQVLTALIVYGLLVLFNQDSGRFSPKQLWRQLQADIHQAIFDLGFQAGLEQGRQEVNLQIT